jgi:hypothetical protein
VAGNAASMALDRRPGEAFKLVPLSSMRVAPDRWDASAALVGAQAFPLPVHVPCTGGSSLGWPPQPPRLPDRFRTMEVRASSPSPGQATDSRLGRYDRIAGPELFTGGHWDTLSL